MVVLPHVLRTELQSALSRRPKSSLSACIVFEMPPFHVGSQRFGGFFHPQISCSVTLSLNPCISIVLVLLMFDWLVAYLFVFVRFFFFGCFVGFLFV